MADAIAKPELMSTILSACHTKIFLPDEEALSPAMSEAYQKVGLSTAEVQILAKAQKKRDYYYRSVKGRRLFQLGLGPAALAFVGMSSEADHRFLDHVVATRPASEYALALLERREIAWATGELERAGAAAAPAVAPVSVPLATPSRRRAQPPPLPPSPSASAPAAPKGANPRLDP